MTLDAAFLFAGRVVSALTTVVVLALLAHQRSPNELGVVSLGLTVGLALAVLPEASLTALFIHDSTKNPSRTGRLLGALLLLRLIALPAVFVVLGAIVAVAYPRDALTIMLVAIGPSLQQVSELARAVFISRRRMGIASIHSIVENMVWAATIAVGARLDLRLDAIFSAAAVAVGITVVAAFGLVAVLERTRPEIPTRSDMVDILRRAAPFAAFSTLAVIAARMDTFLVGLLLPQGIAAAGVYYAVARLVAAAEYAPDAVSRAIYPRLVQAVTEDRARAAAILARPARELIGLGVAMPFGFGLVGGWLLGLLYGPAFSAYAWLFTAFGIAMPFRYIGFLFGTAITSANQQGKRVSAMAAAVLVALALNVILLPIIGIAGALIAGTSGWFVNYIVLARNVQHTFGPIALGAAAARSAVIAFSGFVAALAVRAIVQPGLADPAAGVVFASVVVVGWWVTMKEASAVRASA